MKPIINWKKLITTIWILLWAILIMLLIGKFLFHQWYPIVVENNILLAICSYIDDRYWLKFIIALHLYIPNVLLIYMTCTLRKKPTLAFIIKIIIISVITDLIKSYNQIIGYIPEAIIYIVLPTIENFKYKKFKRKLMNFLFPVIVNAMLFVWQLNVLLIRGIQEIITYIPIIISLALQIDYYIYLIICWIGVCFMGIFGAWLWQKPLTELEAMKAEELAKENPDKETLEEIEKAIAKKKEEE